MLTLPMGLWSVLCVSVFSCIIYFYEHRVVHLLVYGHVASRLDTSGNLFIVVIFSLLFPLWGK